MLAAMPCPCPFSDVLGSVTMPHFDNNKKRRGKIEGLKREREDSVMSPLMPPLMPPFKAAVGLMS
jgi:hypothetical protein